MRIIRLISIALIFAFVMTGCMFPIPRNKKVINNKKEIEEINALINKEEYDKAFNKISILIQKDQYNFIEMNEIAYALLDKGQSEDGLYILNAVVKKNPRFDAALNNLSWAYHDLREYKMADYYADRALEIFPNEDVKYVNKGNALRNLKKYDEALLNYDKALKRNSKSVYAVWGKGMIYYDREDYKKSIELFKQFASMKPDEESSTRYYIANAYKELKLYDEAIREYEKYQHLDDDKTQYLYSIAGVYFYNKKDYTQAMRYYDKIIEMDKKDGWVYLDKAQCLVILGKKIEAIQCIKKAISLDEECLYSLIDYEEFSSLKGMKEYKQLFQ